MGRLFGGVFLGWALGANDSANVFGTAVSSRIIKYSSAVLLTALFVIFGALLQGAQGIHTLESLTSQTGRSASIVSVAAALTVTIMTLLKLPISTSQAVVGAILGIGFMHRDINTGSLTKVLICWAGTPVGGFLFGLIIYFIFYKILKKCRLTIFAYDTLMRAGLVISGCYGAYALGANNVANVTGVYAGTLLKVNTALLIGGLSIALGSVTFSKNVMLTVGRSVVKLDAFSALVAVTAHSVTVHLYAMIGVPVSTSQAIIGAVLAVGFIKGIQTINFIKVFQIFSAWFFTPVLGFIIAVAFYSFF